MDVVLISIPVPVDMEHTNKSFEELVPKLIDLRGVARPPTFDGSDKAWPEFKFRMESLGAMLGMESGRNRRIENKLIQHKW